MAAIPSAPVLASVVYSQDNSSISINNCVAAGMCTTQQQSSTSLSPFSATITGTQASATETSSITGNSISVSEQATSNAQFASTAASDFSVQINVTVPTNFTFSAGQSAGGPSVVLIFGDSDGGAVNLSLVGPGTDITGGVFSHAGENQYLLPFTEEAGILQPGTYTFTLDANTSGLPSAVLGDTNLDSASADITLNLSPVPLPSSLFLLLPALGAILIPTVRRRPKSAVAHL